MRNTWTWVWGALLTVALGCSSGDDGGSSGGGATAGGAAGAAAVGGVAGSGGTATGVSGTGGAVGATGGTGGAPMFMCPADPGTTSCGATACPAVPDSLVTACVQTCCTADDQCGTRQAALGGACMPPYMNTTMCPNEVLMQTNVPGCCVEGTNACGIVDILGGTGFCIQRELIPAFIIGTSAPLAPANCDGTPYVPPMTGGTGGMATGGTGGTATGGSGGMATGGTGGVGTGGSGGS